MRVCGEPRVDRGANPLGLTTDQRGTTRVQNTVADMGAYGPRTRSLSAGFTAPEFAAANPNLRISTTSPGQSC
jgi:hypothetical protein